MAKTYIEGSSCKEVWMDIVGYSDLYEVSNLGNIRNKKTLRILRDQNARGGYRKIILRGDNLLIHRLVITSFLGTDKHKNIVNHKNGIRHDNKLQNLEWCTQSENVRHMYNRGYKGSAFGRYGKHHNSSKPINQLSIDGEIINTWDCARDVQREMGIHNSLISKCCNGNRRTAGGFMWEFIINNK